VPNLQSGAERGLLSVEKKPPIEPPRRTVLFDFCGINHNMMNKLASRLVATAAAAGATLLPVISSAQDAVAGDPTASNAIGGLVIWLLAAGGVIAVGVMAWSDRSAQQGRTRR